MIQQQTRWEINLQQCSVRPPDVLSSTPPPHSSNISCPQFPLYNNGMIFKACPLSALSCQEITLQGNRNITEVCMVSFMQSWWLNVAFPPLLSGPNLLLGYWGSLELSTTNLVQHGSEMSVSWGFNLFHFVLHYLPPTPAPLTPHIYALQLCP